MLYYIILCYIRNAKHNLGSNAPSAEAVSQQRARVRAELQVT